MSEGKPSRQLYVPWRRDTAIPGSESATSDVGAKYGRTSPEVAPRLEGVPIPDIEEFCTQFELESFGDRRVLVKCEVFVVIRESAHVSHSSPLAEIEPVEAADRLEGRRVEQREL